MSQPDDPNNPEGPARVRIGASVQVPQARPAVPAGERPSVSVRAASTAAPVEEPPPPEEPTEHGFVPKEPRSWEECGFDAGLAEQLILRTLLQLRSDTGRNVAATVSLPVGLVKEVLDGLKNAKLVVYRGATAVGDYIVELTEAGREKALETRKLTTYVGPAPVPFAAYLEAVKQQSIGARSPTPADLAHAFLDLSISEEMLERIGPAVTSGRAMFLHGEPGNGKTSLAERMTRCFGDSVWIPYTLLVDGHLVKLYDPALHEAYEVKTGAFMVSERPDRRWVNIKRPTVIAGGELTLDMLEIKSDPVQNVCEAPLQLKSNLGTMVIDDFGRGRVSPRDLLNRWIFPLEKRADFLTLPDGRKFSTPFDALLVFSTNLEPRDLADEAFLRRIPYKVHVDDPTEDEYRALVELLARKMGVRLTQGSVNYLIERHYKMAKRPFRFCHPRDLLSQVIHACHYERRALVADPPAWDRVVKNYFGLV